MSDEGVTRRQLLTGTAALGAATVLGIPASAHGQSSQIVIPAALPEKVYATERVGMSKKTHDEHFKLWQGYARKTNELRAAIASVDTDPAKANQIYSAIRALKVDYTFAYEGYINHNIFFDTLGGSGGPATDKAAALINAAYGNFDNWAKDWKATGIAGRGWVFLAYDRASKSVFNYIGDSQNSYPLWNHGASLPWMSMSTRTTSISTQVRRVHPCVCECQRLASGERPHP